MIEGDHWGWIYFAFSPLNGLIKVGWTGRCPDRRLEDLRAGCPAPIEPIARMPGSMGDERRLHGRFRHLHSHGEWFRDDPELRSFIAERATPWAAPADRFRPMADSVPTLDRQAMTKGGYPRSRRGKAMRDRQIRWARTTVLGAWDDGAWTTRTLAEWIDRRMIPLDIFVAWNAGRCAFDLLRLYEERRAQGLPEPTVKEIRERSRQAALA